MKLTSACSCFFFQRADHTSRIFFPGFSTPEERHDMHVLATTVTTPFYMAQAELHEQRKADYEYQKLLLVSKLQRLHLQNIFAQKKIFVGKCWRVSGRFSSTLSVVPLSADTEEGESMDTVCRII